MLRAVAVLGAVAVMAAACLGPTPSGDDPFAGFRAMQEPGPDPAPVASESAEPIDYEHALDTGIMLRSPESGWGAHLRLPVKVGITSFDLRNVSVDQVTTIGVVPTLEFIVPLDEKWTLLPFVGLGGALQFGDSDLIQGRNVIGLARGGVQAMRWQPFAERYTSIFAARFRYDAALTSQDGLLGDWGSFDLIAELRRAFGEQRQEPRFEPGIYAQGFWFWDPIELEIAGVTPRFVDNQVEIGVSLGSTKPFEILGIAVPRVFIGFRFGEELSSVQIRFGRL